MRPTGYSPETIHNLVISEPMEVCTRSHELLRIEFQQTFHVEKRALIRWKVCTREYIYSVIDDKDMEILAFHWHPETTPDDPILFPHLHISEGAGRSLRQEIKDIHFRTDRVAFEDLALMLIEEFDVVPERSDANSILKANLKKFRDYRSWNFI